MNEGISILFSTAELRILAAASGLEHAILFCSNDGVTRSGQIQAVNALVNDGLLVCDESGLHPKGKLLEFINILSESCNNAVVVRPAKDISPPLCIYYSSNSGLYLVIVPIESKKEYYRVFAADDVSLLNELKQIRLIPSTSEEIDMLETTQDSIKINDMQLSRFERWSISSGIQTNNISVLRRAAVWLINLDRTNGSEICSYSDEFILSWLRGEKA